MCRTHNFSAATHHGVLVAVALTSRVADIPGHFAHCATDTATARRTAHKTIDVVQQTAHIDKRSKRRDDLVHEVNKAIVLADFVHLHQRVLHRLR